jgi:hypothetical protein
MTFKNTASHKENFEKHHRPKGGGALLVGPVLFIRTGRACWCFQHIFMGKLLKYLGGGYNKSRFII